MSGNLNAGNSMSGKGLYLPLFVDKLPIHWREVSLNWLQEKKYKYCANFHGIYTLRRVLSHVAASWPNG